MTTDYLTTVAIRYANLMAIGRDARTPEENEALAEVKVELVLLGVSTLAAARIAQAAIDAALDARMRAEVAAEDAWRGAF